MTRPRVLHRPPGGWPDHSRPDPLAAIVPLVMLCALAAVVGISTFGIVVTGIESALTL